MTGRVVRTANAQARAASEPVRPLRTARRTNLEQSVNGQRTTTTSTHQGRSTVSESTQDEMLGRRHFAPGEEPARVRVTAGKTISLGNFEFLRIDVSVELPCLPEEVHQTYDSASTFVADKLEQEENYILGNTRPSTRKASRRG